MSLEDNTLLLEKAGQIAEAYVGTPLGEAILFNIERNDLDTVARLVKETEDYYFADYFAEIVADSYTDMIECQEADRYQQDEA